MAWASVSLYLCGLCASRKKWWRDIAIILTIAIVATTMVMVVLPITLIMVVMLLTATMAIDRSIDESTKIDRSVDEPRNEDRSTHRCHPNPPPNLLIARRAVV